MLQKNQRGKSWISDDFYFHAENVAFPYNKFLCHHAKN